LEDETYNWKSGEKISKAAPPKDKVNKLTSRDKERVLFCLSRIRQAHEKEA
jgi:hypothetical protein